jgi:threonine dehydrogenase-like Zn-dependent dehydrogenase
MTATFMYGAGDVRVETVADPTIQQPTDAIVRVVRACVCGSDLHPFHSMEQSDLGRPMGHELIGVVEEIGAAVGSLKKGDFVVAPFGSRPSSPVSRRPTDRSSSYPTSTRARPMRSCSRRC